MRNLLEFENFHSNSLDEGEGCTACKAMSPAAMEAVKNLCEGMLCGEAQAWHDDEDPEHTYEGYINECGKYMAEMMGQPGYQSLTKTYAE